MLAVRVHKKPKANRKAKRYGENRKRDAIVWLRVKENQNTAINVNGREKINKRHAKHNPSRGVRTTNLFKTFTFLQLGFEYIF